MGIGRGRPRKSDPDEVLDKAMALFWEQGFEGTSMNDLASATGMAKPGLYATFGDKEALYAKAITRYFDQSEPVFDEIFNTPGPVKDFLRRYLETIAASLNKEDCPSGCFMVNSMIDCASQPSSLESLGRDFHKKRQAALLKRVREAQKQGELSDETDPKALADFFAGQSLALGVMARSGADKKALQSFIDVAMTVLPEGA
ncbi:TetR/AcrR family transcriptional regulator [Denitrobaculum tricleocarpae]|uniref:TetR/AcrR family transcriptional regulator n=1 Tax=Denitrobaculum tricleocarpae TaxID=2591009 RepID=A0A545TF86_9PROT|nr:TetR/AcrR family transcriptional regulator [Denitrobaculum tricleocarpae]TQV75826.1 TetR/AcrR family transcriptional regulator [Denitrobaculum tricleocarpae]